MLISSGYVVECQVRYNRFWAENQKMSYFLPCALNSRNFPGTAQPSLLRTCLAIIQHLRGRRRRQWASLENFSPVNDLIFQPSVFAWFSIFHQRKRGRKSGNAPFLTRFPPWIPGRVFEEHCTTACEKKSKWFSCCVESFFSTNDLLQH